MTQNSNNNRDMDALRNKLKLSTVIAVDPDACSIIDTAGRTALYNFDQDEECWSKTDVEGTLIVYTRRPRPHNMITIINKNSKSNFVEPITRNCDAQLKQPYVLLRNDKNKILGIWFADQSDVPRIYEAICSFIKMDQTELGSDGVENISRPIISSNSVSIRNNGTTASNGEDIMTMLCKARVEFDSKSDHFDQRSMDSLNANSSTQCTNNVLTDFFAKVSNNNTSIAATSTSSQIFANNNPPPATSAVNMSNPVLQQLFQGAAAVGGQASVINNNGISAPVAIPASTNKQTGVPAAGPVIGLSQSGNLQSAPISLQELEGRLRENLHVSNNGSTEASLTSTSIELASQKPNLILPQMLLINSDKPNDIQGGQQIVNTTVSSSSDQAKSKTNSADFDASMMSPQTRGLNKLLYGTEFPSHLSSSSKSSSGSSAGTVIYNAPPTIPAAAVDSSSIAPEVNNKLIYSSDPPTSTTSLNNASNKIISVDKQPPLAPLTSGNTMDFAAMMTAINANTSGNEAAVTPSNAINKTNTTCEIPPLSLNQFALALKHAMKKKEFVMQLHEAYQEVIQQMGSKDEC